MPFKKLGIERPSFGQLSEDQQAYLELMETMAFSSSAREVKSGLDPRTWSVPTFIAVLVAIVTTLGWVFNSGGKLEQFDNRVQAIEERQRQYETTYARRDLLEQQMGYVVTGLNELKVKVDALTTAQRNQ